MRRILLVTLVITIPSFISFYGWSSRQHSNAMQSTAFVDIKAESGIGREHLYQQELIDAKNSVLATLEQQLRGMDRYQIEQGVTNQLIADQAINNVALDRFARDKKIIVTDADVREFIQQNFPGMSSDQLLERLRAARIEPREWKRDIMEQERISKAQFLIYAPGHVTLPELYNEYAVRNTKVSLEYVQIATSEQAAKVSVTDADLQAHYEKNKEKYEVGDQVVYRHVTATLAMLREASRPKEAEILEAYARDKETKYKIEAEARVRHVLVSLAPTATDAEKEAALAKIKTIEARLKAGEPLSTLADEFSEDAANVKLADDNSTRVLKLGGLLPDPVKKDQTEIYGADFVNFAFTSPIDQVSTPILGLKGYSLAQVVSRKDGGYKTLGEVRDTISNAIALERAQAQLDGIRTAFEESRRTQTTLDAFGKAVGFDAKDTSPVLANNRFISGIGDVGDYMSDITDLKEGGDLSPVIDLRGSGYTVVQVKKFIPKHIPALAEVRARVDAEVRALRGHEKAKELAKEVLARVEKGENLTSVGLALKYTVNTSKEPVAIGTSPYQYSIDSFSVLARATPLKKPVIADGIVFRDSPPNHVFVVQINERTPPTRAEFTEGVAMMELQRLYMRRQTLTNEWLRDARAKLEPHYNPDYITD